MDVTTAPQRARAVAALAPAVDAVGVALYRHVARGAAAAVLSPASIALALRMALHGARGETAAELATLLRVSGHEEAAESLRLIMASLEDAGGGADITFRLPNTMWVQSGMPLREGFTGELRDIAALAVRQADFIGASGDVAREINQLIGEQTAGKITNLIAPGLIGPATRLVLANAIYLKAPWAHPFPANATADAPFHLDGGGTVTVPMMRVTAPFGYLRGDGYQAVMLPYAQTRLAMAVMLPDGPLAPLEEGLVSTGLAGLAAGVRETDVRLAMPRFRMSAGFQLGRVLAQLGVAAAFGAAADFSGITAAGRLHIDEVVHRAYIDVDEKGTEAAAATAVMMRVAALWGPAKPPVTVTVDRPFLFAIADTATGLPLFAGKVTNPAAPAAG